MEEEKGSGGRGALVPAPSQGRLQLDLPDLLSSVLAAGRTGGGGQSPDRAPSFHPSREVRAGPAMKDVKQGGGMEGAWEGRDLLEDRVQGGDTWARN